MELVQSASGIVVADASSLGPPSVWSWYEGGYENWATGTIEAQVVSAGPWPVEIPTCPGCTVSFQFDEPAGSSTVTDQNGLFVGTVNNPTVALPGDGYFHGDEAQATAIDLDSNATCLKEANTITVEARVYTTVVDLDYLDENGDHLDDDYDFDEDVFTELPGGRNATSQRIIERKRAFQLTIFRANYAGDYVESRAGKARVILKYFVDPASRHDCPHDQWPEDDYTGADNRWHQISTDIDTYPIVQGHWYKIRAVFDSSNFIQPVYIFIDDLGTDGLNKAVAEGGDENWPGYANASRTINESSSCKWGRVTGRLHGHRKPVYLHRR